MLLLLNKNKNSYDLIGPNVFWRDMQIVRRSFACSYLCLCLSEQGGEETQIQGVSEQTIEENIWK